MECATRWMATGAVMCGLSVALGAFAAHGLDGYFAKKYADAKPRQVAGVDTPRSLKSLDDFKTGARYQMYHGLGLLAVGLLMRHRNSRRLTLTAWCFSVGNLLFAGGLYAYTLSGIVLLGAIPPPIGGTLYLVGWIMLTVELIRGSETLAT